jgi:excisionase family DNA binding protein
MAGQKISEKTENLERATYTIADLARLMQCSERHVHRLQSARAIPGAIRIGRLVRFSRRLVDEWLASGGEYKP